MHTLDTTRVIPGHNGMLLDSSGNLLVDFPEFQTQVNFNNSDYQPAGSAIVAAVPMNYTVTLATKQTVVRDTGIFYDLMEAIKNGEPISFDFQGRIKDRKGNYQRVVYRECVPDGAIDLQNVKPGEIIERAWSFRVNQPPDLQAFLPGFSITS